MSRSRFSTIQRVALWRANRERCFFCEEHVAFRDLEIDHLIPESTTSGRLAELTEAIGLEDSFNLNSTQNLVPTHHTCNRRKSYIEFSEGRLSFYLELWKTKQQTVQDELERLKRQANKEKFLTSLAAQVERGHLTIREIMMFLKGAEASTPAATSEPWVISFSVNVLDLLESSDPTAYAHSDYSSQCDWLEENLMRDLRAHVPSLCAQTEVSGRNGETLSTRVAFWNLDLDHLEHVNIEPWEILEISPFSEVYSQDWDHVFPRAVVETYREVINDPDDTFFGLARCPNCGSPELRRSSTTDYEGDEDYYLIECANCGWNDWTQ